MTADREIRRRDLLVRVIFEHRNRTARTLRNREFLADRAARILRAAGARRVLRMDFPPVPLHVHSTMRMGADPADSVLDAHAEARWVDRLFVGDNSAMANALGGPNPTLTSQAVATRIAERIFAMYFGGDPRVGAESRSALSTTGSPGACWTAAERGRGSYRCDTSGHDRIRTEGGAAPLPAGRA